MHLLKSSSIYLIAGLFSSGIPFLLLPVLTRYLSPSDYGILAIVKSIGSLLLNILVFGQNSAYQRFYHDYDQTKRGRLFINSAILITCCTMLAGIFLIIFQTIIHYDFGFEDRWLIVILFIVYGDSIQLLIMSHIQITNRPLTFFAISTTKVFIVMLMSLYFVVYQGYNWQGRVLGNLSYTAFFLPLGFAFVFFGKKFELTPSRVILRDIGYFGSGLVPGALAGWGANFADRLILANFRGAEATGLYNVGYQFGFIVYLVVSAFGRAWSPFFWDNYLKKGDEGKQNVYRMSRMILLGIISVAIFVFFTGPVLLRIMVTAKFYGAAKFITWIALGYAVQGVQILFSPYLAYHKKTLLMSNIAIFSVVANVGLNFLLIPHYGGQGAAIATFLTFFCSLLLQMVYVYKLERVSIITFVKQR